MEDKRKNIPEENEYDHNNSDGKNQNVNNPAEGADQGRASYGQGSTTQGGSNYGQGSSQLGGESYKQGDSKTDGSNYENEQGKLGNTGTQADGNDPQRANTTNTATTGFAAHTKAGQQQQASAGGKEGGGASGYDVDREQNEINKEQEQMHNERDLDRINTEEQQVPTPETNPHNPDTNPGGQSGPAANPNTGGNAGNVGDF